MSTHHSCSCLMSGLKIRFSQEAIFTQLQVMSFDIPLSDMSDDELKRAYRAATELLYLVSDAFAAKDTKEQASVRKFLAKPRCTNCLSDSFLQVMRSLTPTSSQERELV